MIQSIRPIDEELKLLHAPVIATISDDDDELDSALEGFRISNSGSVMIQSRHTKPMMLKQQHQHQRSTSSTTVTLSSSYGSNNSYPSPSSLGTSLQVAYLSSSYPHSLPRHQSNIPRPPPQPSSLPQHYAYSHPYQQFPQHYHASSNMQPSYSYQMGISPPVVMGMSPTGMSPMGLHISSPPVMMGMSPLSRMAMAPPSMGLQQHPAYTYNQQQQQQQQQQLHSPYLQPPPNGGGRW